MKQVLSLKERADARANAPPPLLRCKERKLIRRKGQRGNVRCGKRGEHERHSAWFNNEAVEWLPVRWYAYNERGSKVYIR